MRIAVASSGLGHVARGIETWARDTAVALARRGADVTLFGGTGCGAAVAHGMARPAPKLVALPGLKRTDRAAACWTGVLPGWTWRWGLKDTYGLEQFRFWRRLAPRLRTGDFDILHTQDPMVAFWCRRARRAGRLRTKEILAHGTEESNAFLAAFDYVQHLAPWHREKVERELGGAAHPRWTAIPNFVDTNVFHPATGEDEKRACRRELGIPENAFLVGTAAAVKKHHKRIDYLVSEFAAYLEREGTGPCLVIAGARQNDTDELIALARERAGDRIRIVLDLPRGRMSAFYRALDVFVLTSLFEMMPIAVLEALASGVPIVTHEHPVLEWMVGDGGTRHDLSRPGGLADALAALTPQWLAAAGRAGRLRAETEFSTDAIVGRYLEYYQAVMERPVRFGGDRP